MKIIDNHNKSAIDLYSGIGGWSLGFKLAGIDISASYEWWEPANRTHQSNLASKTHQVDIRELSIDDLPKAVDFVVGSPPCTQFSYSNRGGSGDIADGLVDIKKFLDVVNQLNPVSWAMENVPRVANVLKNELRVGGKLEGYRHLLDESMIHIYDLSEFGLPQKRRRCIAGNFDYKLLESYRQICPRRTLGDVLDALSKKRIKDPNYRIETCNNLVSELEKEAPLSWEELRYNRESKTNHAIYNNMEFPDPTKNAVRTVTATCTRVSRESIIIRDGDEFRRLSIRERGVLQGFPVSYEFMGESYAAKIKMIGNAIPPVFTYYLANAMLGTPDQKLVPVDQVEYKIPPPKAKAKVTKTDTAGKTYPITRSFRFAIPNLRFKSGTRFELSNSTTEIGWSIKFFYGDSKRILRIDLEQSLLERVKVALETANHHASLQIKNLIENKVTAQQSAKLQSTWAGTSEFSHPFLILDQLGECAEQLIAHLVHYEDEFLQKIVASETTVIDPQKKLPIAANKLKKFAREIVAGILIGCTFNAKIDK
jgi:DNA (cytosine-5)-methyltransferase 1